MIKNRIYLLVLLFVGFGCSTEQNRFDADVSDVPLPEIEVKRYGEALFTLDTTLLKSELEQLQPRFPVFLSGDLNNPVNVNRIRRFVQDTMLRDVYRDCMEQYPDLSFLEDGLADAFHHLLYYFPEAPVPNVYTYVSGFDYEHAVQLYQDNLLIALDMYLGPEYPRYRQLGLPLYVLRRFSRDYMVRDAMMQVAGSMINPGFRERDLLSFMIYEGKKLWFIKAMQPGLDEAVLFDYTAGQVGWAVQNEGLAWAFLIENEMLYTSESTQIQKFIGEAPFTSFFGKESPPRLGWFIGYRIVDAYMQKNKDVSLEQLIQQNNALEILKGAEYKPGM